ncbi:MAG TPA: response regulator transcription factor [Phycisphaerae bacterium]|jgi:DNA-binding response OmpR family regulator|nr:response regulator transcription factor [Phycisphaerae bacterium]
MARRKKILVVDDERDLVELIAMNLQRNGYEPLVAHDGAAGLELARRQKPDLAILDLMMPGLSGRDVTVALKGDPDTAGMPILMLTAKTEETDIIVGLSMGADDYVTKPFSMKVLMARVAAVLRRKAAVDPAAAILSTGPVTIDAAKHEVTVAGRPINLTPTEFKLLTAIFSARGRVLSRNQLMDKAMGAEVFVTDRAIDVHITAVRKKLGEAAWMVHTVRGVGYRLLERKEDEITV